MAEDLDQLLESVNEVGNVGLITVDPITAYMGGKMDSHKATEVRSQLGPLKDFAEQTGVAISSVTHPPKAGGQRAIDQYIGSQAFIASGRIGHLCVEDYDVDPETGEKQPTGKTLLTQPKNNAYVKMPTLIYHIEEVYLGADHVNGKSIHSPKVVWDGEKTGVSADDAMATASSRPRQHGEQEKVQDFLRVVLSDGPMEATKILELADVEHGFTENQVKKAKRKLNVQSEKSHEPDGGWIWSLPVIK